MAQPQAEDDQRLLGTHRYAVFAALVHLSRCLSYSMETLSAPAPPSQKESASWTDEDVNALVNYLHRSRATTEGSNFNREVFRKAAVHLEGIRTKGGPKDTTNTKSKWSNVRLAIFTLQIISDGWGRLRLNGVLSIVFATVQG